ncbi:hypothetical protein [Roseovarius nanhaiticus]|nr:hypothetical protein [Roseovarius nanhaiticus]
MMWSGNYLVAALAVLLIGDVACAQQATVRSGEHDGFSRLVVDVPKRFPWSVKEDGRRRTIAIQGFEGTFDLDQVFDRLSANRLARVNVADQVGAMEIEMNCDCRVDISWAGNSMLVIDILGAPRGPDEPSTAEAALNRDHPHTSGLPVSAALIASSRPVTAGRLASSRLAALMKDQPKVVDQTTDFLRPARKAIAQDITIAASMGLLKVENHRTINTSEDRGGLSATDPLRVDGADTQPDVSRHVSFGTLSATELDPNSTIPDQAHTAAGWACLPDEQLAIDLWGTDRSFAQQMSAARLGFVEDLDVVSPAAALRLARLYVYFGFGKEAQQLVEWIEDSETAEILNAMALIVEQETYDISVFNRQIECDGAVALWSALAQSGDLLDQLPNVNAMLRTLSSYPIHLRELLVPRLAVKFTDWGRADDSARIMKLLEWAPRTATDAEVMARALAEARADNPADAAKLYEDVVNQNNAHSAAAVLEMVWAQIDSKKAVDSATKSLIESHAQEQRGGPLGVQLVDASIAAAASAGLYDEAVAGLLERAAKNASPSEQRAIAAVAALIVRGSSDLQFLKQFLPENGVKWSAASGQVLFEIARRMLDLGFPDEARRYLSASKSWGLTERARYLEAEIDLASGLPEAALAGLMGLEGEEAQILRAKAYGMKGNHVSAHHAYLAAGRSDDALREALLAEAWDAASEIAGPALGNVIDQTEDVEAALDSRQLQRGKQLLEQSEGARSDIAKLLSETGIIGVNNAE